MKKLYLTFFSCATLLFAGCSSSEDTSSTTTESETTSETEETDSGGKVELDYLAWNLGSEEENNLERQMIQKFNQNNENIQVNILAIPPKEDGSNGDYNEYLNTLASQGNLPDVFMNASVSDTVKNSWAANVTDIGATDEDLKKVMPAVYSGGLVNDHLYGIPYAAHIMGIAQNYSIFEELNVEPLEYTYTLEQLMDKIAATSTDKYKGTDSLGIEDWGPLVLSDSLGWGTFDGEKYNFSSPEFAQSIDAYKEVVANKYTGNKSLNDEKWLPEGETEPWINGYIATEMKGSWYLADLVSDKIKFKSDFLPLPNEKIVIAPDYTFIADSSENKEEAFTFAKWMGFGIDGMKQRIELQKDLTTKPYNGIPLNAGADPLIDESFLEPYKQFTNFIQMYESISTKPENVSIEPFKVVPGYVQSRFDADTGVVGVVGDVEKSMTMGELILDIIKGNKNLADHASEMDRIANKTYEDAKAALANK